MREPSRSTVSAEAEARLLDKPTLQSISAQEEAIVPEGRQTREQDPLDTPSVAMSTPFAAGSLLKKKKRDRLLLVSFRMPQGLKEKLELAAKRHEVNQTDIINEAIELNLQRYV